MTEKILVVSGSRTIDDPDLIFELLDEGEGLLGIEADLVIQGGAGGVDFWADRWALEAGVARRTYPADWGRYGRGAGYIRNADMAKVATHGIVIWDGESKGTKHMLDMLLEAGTPTELFIVKGNPRV